MEIFKSNLVLWKNLFKVEVEKKKIKSLHHLPPFPFVFATLLGIFLAVCLFIKVVCLGLDRITNLNRRIYFVKKDRLGSSITHNRFTSYLSPIKANCLCFTVSGVSGLSTS